MGYPNRFLVKKWVRAGDALTLDKSPIWIEYFREKLREKYKIIFLDSLVMLSHPFTLSHNPTGS